MGHRATFEIWVVSRSGKYIKSRDCRATRRNGVKLGCSCGGGGGGSRCLCSCLRDVYDASDQDCTIDAWDVRVDIRAVSSISNLGLVVFCLGHDELLVPEKAGVTEGGAVVLFILDTQWYVKAIMLKSWVSRCGGRLLIKVAVEEESPDYMPNNNQSES